MNAILDNNTKNDNILMDIYHTLDKFLICPFNENGDAFREIATKNVNIIENMLELNHPKALLFKGIFYEYGIIVEKNDDNKAKHFYEKSIKFGEDPYAFYSLGLMSISRKKELKESFQYFERSAQQGNSYGINGLGYCYDEGIGCHKNIEKALDLCIH